MRFAVRCSFFSAFFAGRCYFSRFVSVGRSLFPALPENRTKGRPIMPDKI
jgi:hypothetical protein